MQFTFDHVNINVTDLDKSIAFYEKALGLKQKMRMDAPDGSFSIAFMGDGVTDFSLELTWLADHPQRYDLADNEIHTAFTVADFKEAFAMHTEMGCVSYENKMMGIYFIEDPDGYWMEIVPKR